MKHKPGYDDPWLMVQASTCDKTDIVNTGKKILYYYDTETMQVQSHEGIASFGRMAGVSHQSVIKGMLRYSLIKGRYFVSFDRDSLRAIALKEGYLLARR